MEGEDDGGLTDQALNAGQRGYNSHGPGPGGDTQGHAHHLARLGGYGV